MALLTIYTFPNPILKQKALPVTEFDEVLKETAESMLETMYDSNGIGLASIQVGIPKQLVVVDIHAGSEDLEERDPQVFVNPQIVEHRGETVSEEGCLSVDGYRGEVKRAEWIRLEYQDVDGADQSLEADGLMAICIQHELDHLNGVLFIDHLPPIKQKMVKKRLSKMASQAA
jgi:peptide deformylase